MSALATTKLFHSRHKIGRRLAIMLLLVGAGIYLLSAADHLTFAGIDSPWPVRLMGGLSVLMGGGFGYMLLQRLRHNKPGLVLTAEGFTHFTAQGMGLIRWADVAEIHPVKIRYSTFLGVLLRDPDKYLGSLTSNLARQLYDQNMRQYNVSLLLACGTLESSLPQVEALFGNYLAAARASRLTA